MSIKHWQQNMAWWSKIWERVHSAARALTWHLRQLGDGLGRIIRRGWIMWAGYDELRILRLDSWDFFLAFAQLQYRGHTMLVSHPFCEIREALRDLKILRPRALDSIPFSVNVFILFYLFQVPSFFWYVVNNINVLHKVKICARLRHKFQLPKLCFVIFFNYF